MGEDSHETCGGANGIVNTKLNGVLMSAFPIGDQAVKTLLAASRNYVKIWGDSSESRRHSVCQWNFLAKCHDINTQCSVIRQNFFTTKKHNFLSESLPVKGLVKQTSETYRYIFEIKLKTGFGLRS